MDKPPSSQLPVVRPDPPPYIAAYERFTLANPNRIEAFVAYGLFIKSQYEWASAQGVWPPEEAVANSFRRMLHDPEVERLIETANKIVEDHRQLLVSEHERKFLDVRWREVEERVEGLVEKSVRRHFWKGVSEATTGAFCWMLICILISVGAAFIGIDLLHGVSSMSHVKAAASVGAPPH